MAATFLSVAGTVSSLSSRTRTLSCACSPTGILRIRGFSSCFATSPDALSEWRATSPPLRCGRVVVACTLPSSPMNTARPSTRLFISGLSFRTTEESLINAFKSFGVLIEVNLVMDRIANRPRGFAFLRYATEEESKKAIEGMHGKFLDGRVIFVEPAKPKEQLRQNSKPASRPFY